MMPSLCDRCQAIHFQRLIERRTKYLHYVLHQSRESYFQSLSRRCPLCTLISSQLGRVEVEDYMCKELGAFVVLEMLDVSATTSISEIARISSDYITVNSQLGFGSLTSIDPIPARYQLCYEDTPSDSGRKRKRNQYEEEAAENPKLCGTVGLGGSVAQESPSGHTGSKPNMKLAHLWIQECLKNHDKCAASISSEDGAFLPTRLINVRYPERPFLQETADLKGTDPKVAYVALSYAWGEGKKVVSDKENFEGHKCSIPTQNLPKTFADAFQVTRLLGYDYIWVDAFCIKQDDDDDLHSELPQMGDIYCYAAFTIFAEGSPNASVGLFQMRDPYLYRPCAAVVTITTELGVISDQLTLATTCTSKNYLDARGWVLQEEIFTSRSLRFRKQMSWRCILNDASETRPYPRPRHSAQRETLASGEDRLRLWLLTATQMPGAKRGDLFESNQYDAWYSVVQVYSSKDLSFDSDRLPALSGLAGVFHKAHHSTYVAGLWKEDLQLGLAWYVESNDPRPVRRDRGQEPSWSWASVGMARLRFRVWRAHFTQNVSAGVEIIGVSCDLDNPLNPYGRVKQGTIKLRTRMKRALLRCSSEYAMNRTGHTYGNYSGPDSFAMTQGEHPRFPAGVFDLGTSGFIGEAALDTPIHACLGIGVPLELGNAVSKDVFEQEVQCALLHVQQGRRNFRLTALILEKAQPEAGGYRRLGLLFVKDCKLEVIPLPDWQEETIEIC